MAQTITFNYEGTDYVLEFTRKSVATLEHQGFSPNLVESAPVEQLSLLFYGSFLAHHPNIKREKTDEIIPLLGNKDELWDTLADMYTEVINAFLGDNEDNTKKIEWGASRNKKKTAPQD